MKVDLFIARRLKLKERGSRRSTVSLRVATVGVAFAIAIMLLTIAIVTGFKRQITDKIVGFEAELTVTAYEAGYAAEAPIKLTPGLHDAISHAIPEAKTDLCLLLPGMLKTADNFCALLFRGYSCSKDWSFVESEIVSGKLPDSFTGRSTDKNGSPNDSADAPRASDEIVISQTIASQLGLQVGDKIPTCFFIDGKIRVRNFSIAAIYESNFGEYDKTVAYAPLTTLQRLLNYAPDEATRLEITNLPLATLQESAAKLSRSLTDNYLLKGDSTLYQVGSVLQSGAIYFNWLSLLDTNVVVIIILMSAISIFTLVSSLFILILERVTMIGTLKTLGASNALVRRVFIILASRIMARGLLWGNLVGLTLIAVQGLLRLVPLDPEAYYISFVPVAISWLDIVVLNAVAAIVAMAVMILPSGIISRMSPAKVLRFD